MSVAPSPVAAESVVASARAEWTTERARACEELVRELSVSRWGGETDEAELVAHLAGALRRALPQRRVLVRTVDPRSLSVTRVDGDGGLHPDWRDGGVWVRPGALSPFDVERLGSAVRWAEPGRWAYAGSVEGTTLLLGDSQGPLVLVDLEYGAPTPPSSVVADHELALSLGLAWTPVWQAALLRGELARTRPLAALGELMAGLAHELNNPITAIAGYGELLLERLESASADPLDVERTRKILDSAERMRQLTRALIGYVRPMQTASPDVALNEVVRGAVALCEHSVERSRADVRVECSATEIWLRVGRLQLEQIVVNLVTNACDALTSPGGVVRLVTGVTGLGPGTAAPGADGQAEAYLRVEDDGRGIRAQDLPRVFDPFFTTKLEGKGTGLGLAIVRKLVDGYGGKVEVRSVEGQGTSVTVRFALPPSSSRGGSR
jgi:signal transduction histidine kinase